MSKQSKEKNQTIYKEFSTYSNIFQNRPGLYRIIETLFFIVVLFLVTAYVPSENSWSKLLIFSTAIIFIAGAPYVYQKLLSPRYFLTKNELIIQLGGKERKYSLLNVERASDWKPLYRLDGKKVSLMVSRNFSDRLDEQLANVRKVKKR